MIKRDIQLNVRQRAKFRCEACGKFTRAQYAHIIPDRDEGSYKVPNLLLLCYEHHLEFEPAKWPKNSPKYKSLIKEMYRLRDDPKHFVQISKFISYPEERFSFRIGNNLFRNSPFIISYLMDDNKSFDLLKINLDKGRLIINGWFFSANGKPSLSIDNNYFCTHDANYWDIPVTNNNDIQIISTDKDLYLYIHDDSENIMTFEGQFYYHNLKFKLSVKQGLLVEGDNKSIIRNNQCIFDEVHVSTFTITENNNILFLSGIFC